MPRVAHLPNADILRGALTGNFSVVNLSETTFHV
jgi:hypothetical protein